MWKKIKKGLTNPRLLLIVIKYRTLYFFNPRLLNQGERYDPTIWSKIGLEDKMHIARYEFAKKIINPEEEVLDIACGTGYGSAILAEKCHRVSGVDISESAIKFARRTYSSRENIIFSRGDLLANTIKADTVVSFETVEHVDAYPINTARLLQSAARKRLILSVPYQEQPGRNPHHRHFRLDESAFPGLSGSGQVQFFYQDQDGKITAEKKDNIQNLLLVWTR